MGFLSKLQARFEVYKLEKRYSRHRSRRSTFVSDASYVNGEYHYHSTGTTRTPTQRERTLFRRNSRLQPQQQPGNISESSSSASQRVSPVQLDSPDQGATVMSHHPSGSALSQTMPQDNANSYRPRPVNAAPVLPESRSRLPTGAHTVPSPNRPRTQEETSRNPFLTAPSARTTYQRHSLPPAAFPDSTYLRQPNIPMPGSMFIDTTGTAGQAPPANTPSLMSSSSSLASRSPASANLSGTRNLGRHMSVNFDYSPATPSPGTSGGQQSQPVILSTVSNPDLLGFYSSNSTTVSVMDMSALQTHYLNNPFLQPSNGSKSEAQMAPYPPPLIHWDLNPFYEQQQRYYQEQMSQLPDDGPRAR